ncbi:MAG: hypothetical protein GY858_04040 [Candidatus Omnitrophica bacterium]|nr:hypothetical protein [Candidatus Omnitrophota bacterium]
MEDYNKACNYSFLLLKYRPRSKHELILRLKTKQYSSPVIKKTVEFLQECNYINDSEFVPLFVRSSLNKGWGRRRIDYALKKLGISAELAEKFMPAKKVYKAKIRELIKKKVHYYSGKKNVYQKIVRFLVSRGYDHDEIYEAMQKLEVKKFEKFNNK